MDLVITVVLSIVGTLTPFLLASFAWASRVSGQLRQLHLDMVESSARQDAILAEHERRITVLEVINSAPKSAPN